MVVRSVAIASLISVVASTGCEKTDHDSIDKWTHTEKGPAKLAKTLADESIDADLSAHAAQNLVKLGRDSEVRAALDALGPPRRTAVVAALAPRLWNTARVESPLQLPSPPQIAAKDWLFQIRKYADDATRAQIDTDLIDWYCVASYDNGAGQGRAAMGLVNGAAVLRAIGAPAAKRLIEVANGVIAAPGQDKVKNRIGDELMLGLAATCAPDATKLVLDLAKLPRGDDTLPTRALDQLHKAYVDPQALFDRCDKAGLVPNLDAIVAIAKDDKMPAQAANDAVALIREVGPPQCLPPLLSMIPHPHANAKFKYVGAQAALRCGGAASIVDVVHALPDGPYDHRELAGGVVQEIARLEPKDKVLATMRGLLDDKKLLARWVAVETLAELKSPDDAPRLAAVHSGEKLVGFWGGEKPDPTLGERAKELAAQLAKKP